MISILNRAGWIGGLTAFSLAAFQFGSPSNGRVTFTSVPAFGQAGQLTGYVSGVDSSQVRLYVYDFIPDSGWYGSPTCSPVVIQSTGEFSTDVGFTLLERNATRFSAYLVPNGITGIPCIQNAETIPYVIQGNALAFNTIPRLPGYKTITFSGMNWYVKTAPVKVSPGPQFFIEDNVFVDSQGRLHLKLARCPNSIEWCAAEVFSKDVVGYGTFTFILDSTLNNLDPNTTAGLFTWDEQAAQQFHQEWDFEFSRWGNANATFNSQYVVQPYSGLNHMYRFLMSPVAPSTHSVTWAPGQILLSSAAGVGDGSYVAQWNYAQAPLPTPGDVRLHINYYVGYGQAPTASLDTEIVIRSVHYLPGNPQIGLGRGVDSIGFLGASYQVGVVAGSASCQATIESDSPWMTVGTVPVTGNSSFQYSVSDNLGPARTGNLILRSSSCTPTPGAQVLSVTQAGFVCDTSFDSASTHLGFAQSLRSMFVRATSSTCTWTVASSAPWLKIVSSNSGSGDGSVQVSADANTGPVARTAWLQMNNGRTHAVSQDAAATWFALSPARAVACGDAQAQFGVSWSAADAVQIRLNSPAGVLVGQFGPVGSALLPRLPDAVGIFLLRALDSSVLATAQTSVTSGDCGGPAISPLGVVNAASFSAVALSPEGFGSVFGSKLSSATAQAGTPPYPDRLASVEATLGGIRCPLAYVSPNQINFVVPSSLTPGSYLLRVGSAAAEVSVMAVAPGIFTLSGNGIGTPLAAAQVRTKSGTLLDLPVFQCTSTGCTASAITLPNDSAELFIIVYGTGMRYARTISATMGPQAAEVPFLGAQPFYPGLDQVNLRLTDFSGLAGNQPLRLRVDGVNSNTVDLLFR